MACAAAPQTYEERYCGPLGGVHSYRPYKMPPGVGLLQPPPGIAPIGFNETRLLPVMRTEDDYPIHFFYYADGCSDLF
jgi:hypothetical protein